MKSVLKQALSLLLVILISVIKVNAQETTAEIQGLITVGNAGVAGATVTAVHQPTGTKYVTTSRADGRYNLTNLKIGGPYLLQVSYVGMKADKQDDINLLIGQTYKANFSLVEASSNLKEVLVSSAKQDKIFNNARTGSQETFNRNQITSLPTISRSYKDIIKLTPTYNSGSFGGQSSQLNNITIDGANFNNSFGLSGDIGGQTGQNAVSLDAIEQIQVNTSPFDVKNGGFVGGGINSVSRSGTNTYSGSVYQYAKNKDWQGYEVNAAPYTITVPKQDYSYDLKGFTAGGAIIKNKLFIFVNGEQESNTTPGTIWSASSASNPANGSTISAANKDSLDKLSAFLKSKYNYDPGAYQGYSYVASSKRLTVKIDWNINENNTLTFKYNYLKSASQIPPSNSGSASTRQAGVTALPFYGAGYEINNNAKIFIAELNTKFSNKISNKLQVGYTALRDYRNALTSKEFPMVDILDGNGKPFTSFGYELYTYGNKLNTDVYQLNDNLSIYAGKHEITLGTQSSFKKYLNGFSPNYEGTYRFASLNDFINSANGLGTKSTVYSLSYTLGGGAFPLVGPKDFEAGVYVQDKYRATDKLTITYGVRFDYSKFYNTFLYNPVVDTLTKFYAGIHANTGAAPNAAVQISPRIGFNYDVNGDQSLQIRGGAGLFQGAPPFVWISNQASNSGMALFGSFTNNNTNIFSPDVNAYRPAATATLSKSYSINVTDPNYKFPQVFKSTLAADKKLGNGWTVTAEGTYTKQFNASVFQNIALPNTGLVKLADGRYRFPFTSSYPFGGTQMGGTAVSAANNPSIGNAIYMTNSDNGYAWTGTLQVQKITKNFIFTAAYTRMEAKDAAVSGSTAATMWGSKVTSENPNNFTIGNSNNYIPHRIIASVVYKKEFIKDQVTSVGMVYEGAPNYATSYYVQGDVNNDGILYNDLMFVPADPSQIKLINATGDTRTQTELWNQLDAFIQNNPYLSTRRGQFAERNAYVLPWTHKLDLNFTQDVRFTVGKNKHTLRFTADIYNFTNLLNKDWGVYYIPTTTTPLVFTKIDTDGKTPVYTFPYLDAVNKVPFTRAYKPSPSLGSRYQIQIGVRYLFN
jgi:Carboxypeptidase regulatory-like domain